MAWHFGEGHCVVSAPGTGASVASTSGLGIFSFHTPDMFMLFFFAQNVSTKGKIFNTPWDHARPSRGQRGALTCCLLHQKRALTLLQSCPDRDSHLLTWCPPVQHTPCAPSACRRGCVSDSAAHPCPGPCPLLVLCWVTLWCPRVLQLVGTVHSPCPWVAWQHLLGRGAAGETSA